VSWMRPLGTTGLQVSALGLGTVKLGRDRGVKYPGPFTIPDDRSAAALLALARDLGINLLDTAPAYGASEERLGRLLRGQRRQWVICSKVGEAFEDGVSRFDFTPEQTRRSVRRSLARLQTDVIDIVLVHSDGNDLGIIRDMGTLQALQALKSEGLIRAYGMSTKTIEGGLAAAAACDVVMPTYNLLEQQALPVLDACARRQRGALVKKPLASGHLAQGHGNRLQACMDLVFAHPGTSAAIVGTISAAHLRSDVSAAQNALSRRSPAGSC
jgi:aryl-alcohol dehydrogenase-like predicted oxidoreductase